MRRPPRFTHSRSSAASDLYKRQPCDWVHLFGWAASEDWGDWGDYAHYDEPVGGLDLSLLHISEPTRPY